MRILCVSDTYPWPAVDGYRQRLSNVATALAETGDLDLFAVVDDREDLCPGPVTPPVGERGFISPRPSPRQDPARMLGWLASSLPRAVLWHDWRRARVELVAWAESAYDVVWYSHLDPFMMLSAVEGPAIVDLDNLENLKLRAQRQLRRSSTAGRVSPPALLGQGVDLVDEWRWSRCQRAAAARSARVVVCSELDRSRLGSGHVSVIPNGYERRGAPVGGQGPASENPVFTMVGLMTYPPNVDAARHFAREVLPVIRNELPTARFRIVGRAAGEMEELAAQPGVDVRGQVADVRVELATTDVVVVPVRFGGGTRIKLLEAFAHHVPVVATTVGAEGIDAAPDVHLLVADDGRSLAHACLRLVRDEMLRQRLVEAAAQLYEQQYRWDLIRPRIATVACEVAAGARMAGEP